MRLAVHIAVLAIALGSVLLGLDWLSAPMSPMVNTEAGLHGPVASLPPPPIVKPAASNAAAPNVLAPPTPTANPSASTMGAPIVPPSLSAPAVPTVPVPSASAAQAPPQEPIASPEPAVSCNVDACTAAYRSFRASDCTYMPSNGLRKLCAK